MFGKAKKIIGVAITIVYGGYLLATTIVEAKGLIEEVKKYKRTKNADLKKSEDRVVETCFVD